MLIKVLFMQIQIKISLDDEALEHEAGGPAMNCATIHLTRVNGAGLPIPALT